MDIEMTALTAVMVLASALAPITIAFVEMVKSTVKLPANYIPLVALALGMVAGYLSFPFVEADLYVRLWAGALGGLSGVGLFELSINKKTPENFDQ